jgi:hypothetical protein
MIAPFPIVYGMPRIEPVKAETRAVHYAAVAIESDVPAA